MRSEYQICTDADPECGIQFLSGLVDANPAHVGIGVQLTQRVAFEANLIGVVWYVAKEAHAALLKPGPRLCRIVIELHDGVAARLHIGGSTRRGKIDAFAGWINET